MKGLSKEQINKKIFKKKKINVLNEKYKKIIIENILNDIKADLKLINVVHQSFVSEKENLIFTKYRKTKKTFEKWN